jgi:hypothetical protein
MFMCVQKSCFEEFGDSLEGGFLNIKLLSDWTSMLYFNFEQLTKPLANMMKNKGEVVPKLPILVE